MGRREHAHDSSNLILLRVVVAKSVPHAKGSGSTEYPAGCFYRVPQELADKWVAQGHAALCSFEGETVIWGPYAGPTCAAVLGEKTCVLAHGHTDPRHFDGTGFFEGGTPRSDLEPAADGSPTPSPEGKA